MTDMNFTFIQARHQDQGLFGLLSIVLFIKLETKLMFFLPESPDMPEKHRILQPDVILKCDFQWSNTKCDTNVTFT